MKLNLLISGPPVPDGKYTGKYLQNWFKGTGPDGKEYSFDIDGGTYRGTKADCYIIVKDNYITAINRSSRATTV